MRKVYENIGKRFGSLTVIGFTNDKVRFKCDCGGKRTARLCDVKRYEKPCCSNGCPLKPPSGRKKAKMDRERAAEQGE